MKKQKVLVSEFAFIQFSNLFCNFLDYWEGTFEHIGNVSFSFDFFSYNRHPTFSTIWEEPWLTSRSSFDNLKCIFIFHILFCFDSCCKFVSELFREVLIAFIEELKNRFVPFEQRSQLLEWRMRKKIILKHICWTCDQFRMRFFVVDSCEDLLLFDPIN